MNISVDRLKASSLGVSGKEISNTLNLAYGELRYGYFLKNNKQYYVIGQVEKQDRKQTGGYHLFICPLKFRSDDSGSITLSALKRKQ